MSDRLNARGLDESALKAARLAWTAEYVGGREGANPLEAAIPAYLAARGSVSPPNEAEKARRLRIEHEVGEDCNCDCPADCLFEAGWKANPAEARLASLEQQRETER